MSFDPKPFSEYASTVEKTLATGHASEGSHYPTLKALLQSVGEGVVATILPSRIECGAPDFLVTKGPSQVGYMEAKDIGKSLDEAEKSEQLSRYRDSLSNLILTDYLEFRWYRNGKRELEAKLGTVDSAGKIRREKKGIEEVAKLLIEFFRFEAPGVGTPKELAVRMARLAHRIREGAEEALNKGIAADLLSGLYKAFQATLIPGLEIKVFADMYAQTIAYGLFAARCETANADDFSRQKAALLIPKTNPFLRDLFYQITGPELDDEPYKWAVDELVQLLKKADMTEIVRGLSKGTGKDDPVVYFYEDFLREYDKKISEMRGVYYTPIPVVSYIVRSIDYLLKNTFRRSQGLADENTDILDPAAGTGTFLYAVINEIYESMSKQGQMGKWDGYVADHLLPHIFGFELLMTPYVIAHLKLELTLKNTGYTFQSKERLGIYLTNSLEPATETKAMLMAPYLVRESKEANEVKNEKRIMVVLGNPPYSGISAKSNRGKWITELIDGVFDRDGHEIVRGYKTIDGKPLGERKHWLQDDYVKFIRFGQWRIERTGEGILAFITNHSYLDNLTFRGMRQSLMDTFDEIYILDLHGNVKKREVVPDRGKNENVFDIKQGVAISLFVKKQKRNSKTIVRYADFWGSRESKNRLLMETDIALTPWTELEPKSPNYFFVQRHEELLPEYQQNWRVTEIFRINSNGVLSKRDNFATDFDREALETRVRTFRNTTVNDSFIRESFALKDLPNDNWSVTDARRQIQVLKDWEGYFRKVSYRTFDERWIFYHHSLVARLRFEVSQHMLKQNLSLICQRQTYGLEFHHVFVADKISDHNFISNLGGCNVFPMYLYPPEQPKEAQPEPSTSQEAARLRTWFPEERPRREANLNPEFIKDVSEKLGLKFIEDGKGDLKETFGPEDIFNYAYAIFHSPTYRSRYAEFLKIDFPRLPLTSDLTLFRALCEKGAELVSWHLLTNPSLQIMRSQIKYDIKGSDLVEKVRYDDNLQRVYINKTQYFEGIAPDVWNFHIGGYQVCEKWLKYRKGRTLTYDDQSHYQDIAVAIKETFRLMVEIDKLIPGWPVT